MSVRENIRVMVVDDMGVSRALVVNALDEMGVIHYSAEADPKVALAKLSANPVHLVLCDMNMPGMNGLQLLEALRRQPATANIGFIVITGTPSPDIIQKGQALRLNNLVAKPFDTPKLRSAIEQVIGKRL
ncbi:response regulator [Marivita lacus]|uniref:Response regulator n=1 Tax=Marivita lacus TaxID=1323742 RepID=A0ABQ1KWI8_9RHOB|nr:response regulator [Marivita lacus]GGC09792.1 response regulator [Marivita lacus]